MTNPMLAAALAYAERGWPIFPVRADKTPFTTNGVTDATTDPKKIQAWWAKWPTANIALNAGEAGFVVFDIDPGATEGTLQAAIPDIKRTALVAKTPRGGSHHYYDLAEGEIVANSASKVADHIDVRSFHGYVLLPPSKTADGSYSWISEGKPAFRTDEMLRVCNSARDKSENRDNWLIEPDLAQNVAEAVKWLKAEAKPAVAGQGGDNCAYATAAMMKSFGISEALAVDLMMEHWNPRCVPPWTADEIEHFQAKVANGYSYNTSPPGNCTDAYHVAKLAQVFKPIQKALPSGWEATAGRFRLVDRQGIEHIAEPKWLIPALIPEQSYCILFGAFGTFKTFVALDMALSIATGFPSEGVWQPVTSGAVLYAAGEGRSSMRKRIQAWEKLHWGGNRAEGFLLGDPVPHVTEDLTPWLELALAKQPQGYKLVVIDTIGRAMAGINENAQEHASKFTAMCQRIQYELGCAVLALHHTGHDAKDRERGSTVFAADADARFMLSRDGKGYDVVLSVEKQKDAEEAKPTALKLVEVALTNSLKSLAVVPGQVTAEHQQRANSQAQAASEIASARLVMKMKQLFQDNPSRRWMNGEMCVALEEEGLSAATIKKDYLPELRCTTLKEYYDKTATVKQPKWRLLGG